MSGSRWAPRAGAEVGQYVLSEVIARGSTASIWRARLSGDAVCDEDVAIKFISAGRVRRELIDNEVETLRLTCAHPNIVNLLQAVHIGQWSCLVMPLASGTELGPDLEQSLSTCGKFTEAEARGIFRQTISAVAHCHSRGVYHGDLKMENVLLQQCPAKEQDPIAWLCDFGCATTCRDRSETVGTANYMAPEVVDDKTRYDASKADMFSLGVLLYTLLAGHFPFARPPLSALNSKATRDAVRAAYHDCDPAGLKFPASVSPDAASLVRAMLQREPAARPCAATVAADKWLVHEGVPPAEPAAEGALAGATPDTPSLRCQTEPEPLADAPNVSAAWFCPPNGSLQPELVSGGAARCECCGLLRPRTLSLPTRLAPRGCDNQIPMKGCPSIPCDPCC